MTFMCNLGDVISSTDKNDLFVKLAHSGNSKNVDNI